jgi:hypothetical protein
MSPNAIQQMPLIHQCHTRSNNLFHIFTDYDNDDDTMVASNCSTPAPLPSLPSSDLPVNPPVHPAPRQLASHPALCPITAHPAPLQVAIPPALHPTTVQPNIPPPKVLANPSFIPATTPIVPYNNVYDLQLSQLLMPFQQAAITKQQTYSHSIVEPNDKHIITLLRCSTVWCKPLWGKK